MPVYIELPRDMVSAKGRYEDDRASVPLPTALQLVLRIFCAGNTEFLTFLSLARCSRALLRDPPNEEKESGTSVRGRRVIVVGGERCIGHTYGRGAAGEHRRGQQNHYG